MKKKPIKKKNKKFTVHPSSFIPEFTGNDLTEAAENMMDRALTMKPDLLTKKNLVIGNAVLSCRDARSLDLDLGRDLWLTKGRWSKFLKDYVPLTEISRFIYQSQEIMNGWVAPGVATGMLFRSPDVHSRQHRWGGCLHSISYCRVNKHNHFIRLDSRTTYLGYVGMLDLAIASLMAKRISPDQPIPLVWNVTALQVEMVNVMPYLLSRPALRSKLVGDVESEGPGWMAIKARYNMWASQIKTMGPKFVTNEKFQSTRKVKKYFSDTLAKKTDSLPESLHVKDLPLSGGF